MDIVIILFIYFIGADFYEQVSKMEKKRKKNVCILSIKMVGITVHNYKGHPIKNADQTTWKKLFGIFFCPQKCILDLSYGIFKNSNLTNTDSSDLNQFSAYCIRMEKKNIDNTKVWNAKNSEEIQFFFLFKNKIN